MPTEKELEPFLMLRTGKRTGDIKELKKKPSQAAFQKIGYFNKNKYADYIQRTRGGQTQDLANPAVQSGVGDVSQNAAVSVEDSTPTPVTSSIPNAPTRLESPGTGEFGYGASTGKELGGGTLNTVTGNIPADAVRSTELEKDVPAYSQIRGKGRDAYLGQGTFSVIGSSAEEGTVGAGASNQLQEASNEYDAMVQKNLQARAEDVRRLNFELDKEDIMAQAERIKRDYIERGYPKTAIREANKFIDSQLSALTDTYTAGTKRATELGVAGIEAETDAVANRQKALGDIFDQNLKGQKFEFEQQKQADKLAEQDRQYGLSQQRLALDAVGTESLLKRRADQTSLETAGLDLREQSGIRGLETNLARLGEKITLQNITPEMARAQLRLLLGREQGDAYFENVYNTKDKKK